MSNSFQAKLLTMIFASLVPASCRSRSASELTSEPPIEMIKDVPGFIIDYNKPRQGSADGYDSFHFKRRATKLVPTKLSVIMGATFVSTPTIGGPGPGWNGPTYGLHRKFSFRFRLTTKN